MGVPRLRILEEADVQAIDEAARVLLFHTGVDVHSESAREALAHMGARVVRGSPRVLFSRTVIDKALAAAPREVVLASRDGKHDLTIPDGQPHVTTDGTGVNVWDLETGRRRPSTTKDLADLARVADALDTVDLQWPMVVAGDAPNEIHGLVEAATALENTSKHVQHEALSASDAEVFVRMAATIAGGPKALRKRPIISSIQCPVSPLTLEQGSTEGLLVLARAGVPVVPLSMVLMGGSSPVDLASALVIANAENLASLCVAQAAAPGAPVIYGVSSGPIDMRSGSFGTGSPETGIINVAGVEMARYYRLPCSVGGLAADADSPGFQAGMEKMGTGLLPMLAGADLITGTGSVDTNSTMSLEQLILDDDLVEYARRVIEPVRVGPETIHLEMLSRLGPGGNFLKEKHTLLHFREALWSPKILLRDGYVEGDPAEARARSRARAKARELLRQHEPAPLDADIRRDIRALIPKVSS
ncbi:MAG: trimethylamine methyltransferase family protein [Thermoplasmata archaeon]